MVEKFECSIRSETMKVKTPFPVCQNVWADFVMQTFPKFQFPAEHHQNYHHGKYLNRKRDYDEIADGQAGDYYCHAYLPHEERRWSGLVAVNGLIYVPDCRVFYLEQIQADLEENPRTRTALLDSLRQVHAETVGYLIKHLMQAPREETNFRDVKTTKELRDKFGKGLVEQGLLDGWYKEHGHKPCNAYAIDKIPIGELPLSMNGQNVDFLRSQTCLDFLRVLDDVAGEDRELNETDLTQIPLSMRKKYNDIVRV